MSEFITRQQAIVHGLKRYRDGTACRYGHVGERRANDKACLVCVLERQRLRRRTSERSSRRPGRPRRMEKAPTKIPLAEIRSASSFIAPPTRAQLMARR